MPQPRGSRGPGFNVDAAVVGDTHTHARQCVQCRMPATTVHYYVHYLKMHAQCAHAARIVFFETIVSKLEFSLHYCRHLKILCMKIYMHCQYYGLTVASPYADGPISKWWLQSMY